MPMILNGTGDITGLASVNSSVSAAEIGYLDGVTSALQTQITAKVSSKILQVVSTIKQDTFTTTSTTLTDVTGLSASITPSSASNTVLVFVSLALGNSATGGYTSRAQILRGSTVVGNGTAASNRPAGTFAYLFTGTSTLYVPVQTMVFVDSPASTSAQTYKVQIGTETNGTATIGRSSTGDADVTQLPRVASSITLLEVAA